MSSSSRPSEKGDGEPATPVKIEAVVRFVGRSAVELLGPFVCFDAGVDAAASGRESSVEPIASSLTCS